MYYLSRKHCTRIVLAIFYEPKAYTDRMKDVVENL